MRTLIALALAAFVFSVPPAHNVVGGESHSSIDAPDVQGSLALVLTTWQFIDLPGRRIAFVRDWKSESTEPSSTLAVARGPPAATLSALTGVVAEPELTIYVNHAARPRAHCSMCGS